MITKYHNNAEQFGAGTTGFRGERRITHMSPIRFQFFTVNSKPTCSHKSFPSHTVAFLSDCLAHSDRLSAYLHVLPILCSLVVTCGCVTNAASYTKLDNNGIWCAVWSIGLWHHAFRNTSRYYIKCKKLISLQHRVRATKSHVQNSTNHFSGIMW